MEGALTLRRFHDMIQKPGYKSMKRNAQAEFVDQTFSVHEFMSSKVQTTLH